MPELPEVETIKRQLSEVVVDKTIAKVEVLRQKSFEGEEAWLLGKKIIKVGRTAKVIEFEFDKVDWLLICHLKMTGQLIYVSGELRLAGGHPTADWTGALPSKHTRVIITFSDGSRLYFNDMRVFGWLKMMKLDKYKDDVSKKPPDVVGKNFDSEYLHRIAKKSKKAIKLLILDQALVGGLGNIYANDGLNLAKIRPDRESSSLCSDECKKIVWALKKVVNLGIKLGGASAANYVDLRGMGGSYQKHFLVYKREGRECKNCGGTIVKIKLGGRGTFYCPRCQK